MHQIIFLELVKSAELYAKDKHSGKTTNGTTYSQHLENVVNRLKSLGVINSDILCAGWLCNTLENTDTSFDDLYEQFGDVIAVLTSSISKDMTLPRKQRNKVYSKQLKDASSDAKIILLCDISANLSDLKNYDASKSKIMRQIRQNRHHLILIKNELVENSTYPQIITLLDSANQILKKYGQKNIL